MKLLMTAIALSAVIATPAFAAKAKQDSRWYLQASYGEVFETDAKEEALKDLSAQGHTVETIHFDNGSDSYQIELGYQITDNWAATIGYVDFGDTEFVVDIETPYADLLLEDISDAAPRFGDGVTFGVAYSFRPLENIALSIDSGVLLLESEYNAQVNVGRDDAPVYYKQSTDDSSVQWYVGSGLSYMFDKIEVGVYYRYYDIDHVVSQWVGGRIGYHF